MLAVQTETTVFPPRNPRGICTQCLSRVCEHCAQLPPKLTPLQTKLLLLLSGGLSNQEIAHALRTTRGTVKVYLSRSGDGVFAKLHVTSRFEAALWALAHMDLLKAAQC